MLRLRAMVLVLFVYLLAFIEVNVAQEYMVRLRIRPQADATEVQLTSTLCDLLDLAGILLPADCVAKLTVTTDTTYTN